mgnify:CR=1 FL=1
MQRRSLLQLVLAGLFGTRLPAILGPAAAQEPARFDFQTVIDRARAAASAPFQSPAMTLAPPFADLSYDQYRAIRFREDRRLFGDGGRGFQMDLLPPGGVFTDRVEIAVVQGGIARPIGFSTDYFDFAPQYFPYPDGRAPSGPADGLGFTGLRLRASINRPGIWDEVAVFQGASYFRAVARDTLYGLSARGLAIGTGEPTPEEFPLFTAFWVEEPLPGASSLKLWALLDGPSVAGAYQIEISPGSATAMEVRSVLFPRREIANAGIAPLTSMFYFGPESRAGIDDFRNAVHDSEGLWIVSAEGERLWRPLRNPAAVEVSAFRQDNPRRFGLIQRNRDFGWFQDPEARYELRASAWVEPASPWGNGAVLLFELPTGNEFSDNVVAFWRPEAPLAAGSEQRFDYRLTWGPLPGEEAPIARIVATRGGRALGDPEERVFVIDFELGMIDPGSLTPQLTATTGTVTGLSIAPLPGGTLARVGFHFRPEPGQFSEFRLTLASGHSAASETWLYRWSPGG